MLPARPLRQPFDALVARWRVGGVFLRAWPAYHQHLTWRRVTAPVTSRLAFSGGSGREVRAHLRRRLTERVGPRVEESALMLIDPYPWSALWKRCGSGRADGLPRRSWRLTRHPG
jgi:hypothetical protein